MLRLLSLAPSARGVISRTACRVAVRACPAHVQRVAGALQTSAAPVRTFAARAQKEDEDEEDDAPARAPVSIADARANLARSLSEELSELELSNEWTTAYIRDHALTVKTSPENDGVLATREVDGHKIQITFRAGDYTEADQEENEEGAERTGSDDPINEHVFFVDIVNPAGKILRVDCANAPDGELVIERIAFPSAVSADPTALPTAAREDTLPETEGAMDFNELYVASQENCLDLFESLGVDDDLALFVANQAQLVRTARLQADLTKLKEFAQ